MLNLPNDGRRDSPFRCATRIASPAPPLSQTIGVRQRQMFHCLQTDKLHATMEEKLNTQNSTKPGFLSEEELQGLKNFKLEIRVRYSETDMSGYPHHSNYFVWLEEARVALLRALGLSYRVIGEEGIFFPIVEASCKLLNPVRMDDIIEIYPKILTANRRFIKITYDVLAQQDLRKVAEANTMNVSVNAEGKATALPQKYLDMLNKLRQMQDVQTNRAS